MQNQLIKSKKVDTILTYGLILLFHFQTLIIPQLKGHLKRINQTKMLSFFLYITQSTRKYSTHQKSCAVKAFIYILLMATTRIFEEKKRIKWVTNTANHRHHHCVAVTFWTVRKSVD